MPSRASSRTQECNDDLDTVTDMQQPLELGFCTSIPNTNTNNSREEKEEK
jgi:hypothetical protein